MAVISLPRRPAPLRDASGNLIAEFADVRGDLYTNDGERISGQPLNVDDLIRDCPYRSYRLQRVPGIIGAVWVVPDDDPTPPLFILQEMAQAVIAGYGVLLLATDKAARNRARNFIERLFRLAGVDAAADAAKQPGRWRPV